MLRKISVAVALIGICSSSPADELLLQRDVGHNYAQVRKDLLKEGNLPVDQAQKTYRQCTGSEGVCAEYPEVEGCAIDQNTPCRFEWQSPSGRRSIL